MELVKFNPLIEQKGKILAKSQMIRAVTDDELKEKSLEILKEHKSFRQTVSAIAKELKKAPQDFIKQVNEMEKSLLNHVEDEESRLKRENLTYELKKQREREKAIQEALEKKRKEEEEIRLKSLKDVTPEPESFDSILNTEEDNQILQKQKEIEQAVIVESMQAKAERDFKREVKEIQSDKLKGVRKVKKIRVVDEMQIPREYLTVDLVKLRAAVLTNGLQVAGVEVYEEETLALR